jgi:hypothetical protein
MLNLTATPEIMDEIVERLAELHRRFREARERGDEAGRQKATAEVAGIGFALRALDHYRFVPLVIDRAEIRHDVILASWLSEYWGDLLS